MTRVVNLQHEAFDDYIGRPKAGESWRWGNPFSHRGHGIVQVSSLDDSLLNYAAWLRREVQVKGLEPPLLELIRKQLRGRRLGCFCVPQPCHGLILAHVAEGGEPCWPIPELCMFP